MDEYLAKSDPRFGRGWSLLEQADAKRNEWLDQVVKKSAFDDVRDPGPPPVLEYQPPAPPVKETKPVTEETEDGTDVKHCSRAGCGKKLRSDNTRGMCSKCWMTFGRYKKNQGGGAEDDEIEVPVVRKAPRATKAARPTRDDGIADRFAVVTQALGLDTGEVLDQLRSAWLEDLKAKFVDSGG